MLWLTPSSNLTDTLCPYTTLDRAQRDGADKPHDHQREILGRAEAVCDSGERCRKGRDDDCADAAGRERGDRRRRDSDAGPAAPGHLIAVDDRHDRRGLARQIARTSPRLNSRHLCATPMPYSAL